MAEQLKVAIKSVHERNLWDPHGREKGLLKAIFSLTHIQVKQMFETSF